ncbi:MAG: NAD(+)/NADH kinase [Candidatus Rokubacteria bacterium]|nr:NAD(+)/NADH kinase [Candidatus Rokubacteria bacterium]
MIRIGIVAKADRPDAPAAVRELVGWLRARGREVVVDRETAVLLPAAATVVERPVLPGRVDVIIVLGGDGTLLAVARAVGALGVPILGVNLGGLGFLTATTLEELYPTLEALFRGEYSIEERMLLTAEVRRHDEGAASGQVAMNDVVITKGALGRIIELEVSVDGQLATAYRADGLIISTPTGSTAYNLSAYGPILFPTLEALILTPICSHTLTNRPIVLPADVVVEVSLVSDSQDVVLTIDGQVGIPLRAKDMVRVRPAPSRIRLIRDPNKSYFQVLRAKLKWGER